MAHWIIEDKGFGGQLFECSNCGDVWNDIFHSEVGCWDVCPSCGEEMDEEREYVKKKLDKLKEHISKLGVSASKASNNLGSVVDIYKQIAKNAKVTADKCEQINKLEFISGMTIDELIEKFVAGWVLVPSVMVYDHAEFIKSHMEEIDMMIRAGYLHAGEPVIREPLVVNVDFEKESLDRMKKKCEEALKDPNTPVERLFISPRRDR